MGCMQNRGKDLICPHCGWVEGTQPESPVHLPPRTVLKRRYMLGRVLGQGGFGITYLGWDVLLKTRVAIKEYLPQHMASRSPGDIQIVPFDVTGPGDDYKYGLEKFLDEARTLAQLSDNPGIVAVRDYFEANGTAYLVMTYLDGYTLDDYLARKGGKISFDETMKIMIPVLEALQDVHNHGVMHRDISPDNIFITRQNQVKLLDFGAARYAVGDKSRSLSIILKPGYAPEEQYRSKGTQGPWTDTYAAAATIYRSITGKVPPESLARCLNDTLVPPSSLNVGISPAAEAALMKGLAVKEKDRFSNITEFKQALLAEGWAGSRPGGSVSHQEPVGRIPQARPAMSMGTGHGGSMPLSGPGEVRNVPVMNFSQPPPNRKMSGYGGPGGGPQWPAPPGPPPRPPGPVKKKGKGKGDGTRMIWPLLGLGVCLGIFLLVFFATDSNRRMPVVPLDYPDGTKYDGEYDDELSYEGETVAGRYHGNGTYTWHVGKDYDVRYEGDFRDGQMDGGGKYTGPNGDTYDGGFSKGLFEGHGVWTDVDGYEYDGKFVAGKRTGQAKATFPDGRIYKGDFVDGVMEGQGKMEWPDGQYYEGDFANDEMTGQGRIEWSNGVTAEGDFINGQLDGQGKMDWPNGDHYEGGFVSGKKEGQGKMKWADGSSYTGDFKNDDIEGQGVLFDANGVPVFQGTFKDGQPVTPSP